VHLCQQGSMTAPSSNARVGEEQWNFGLEQARFDNDKAKYEEKQEI
jgi:hypothetical protein